MTEITNLLQQVSIIQKKYDEIAMITGENFNIFSILSMERREVKTHSAFLGELLNPKGSHGLKDLFLKLFIKEVCGDNLNEFETASANAITEEYISVINEDKTKGGRVDIVIKDAKGNVILIENKIDAYEQENQLIRYRNAYPQAKILFLTLTGYDSNTASEVDNNQKDYISISYKEQIVDWLEFCLKEAVNHPMLREAIKQYIYLIKKLTNQTTHQNMENEILDKILNNPQNLESALTITGIGTEKIKLEICKRLISKIKDKIGKDLTSENYDDTVPYGKYESGMWFSKNTDFKIGVLLFFNNNFNLELGIDVNSDDGEIRQSIREINDSQTNWVKRDAEFDKNFNNLKWEEVLEENNVNEIVIKINQLIEVVKEIKTEKS
ncbi:PD-(D/E)XK nuclease family protein [Flavobacterium ovatum]|uniref:PDDEXK-like family protein n=1 Tax=Flavobacterium ovatum TaxID=1928857 RepID=UPI00344CD5BC